MKKNTLIIYVSSLFLVMGFTTKKTNLNCRLENNYVTWYFKLLDKSFEFLKQENNRHFKDTLQLYIDTCTEYNFSKNNRLESYMCQPIILNKKQDKAIVLVLSRIFNLANERSDNIHYVSAKYENNHWIFRVKKGHVDGFDYHKNAPTLSDTEICIDILGRLVQYGYMKKGEIDSEKIFNTDMYVLK